METYCLFFHTPDGTNHTHKMEVPAKYPISEIGGEFIDEFYPVGPYCDITAPRMFVNFTKQEDGSFEANDMKISLYNGNPSRMKLLEEHLEEIMVSPCVQIEFIPHEEQSGESGEIHVYWFKKEGRLTEPKWAKEFRRTWLGMTDQEPGVIANAINYVEVQHRKPHYGMLTREKVSAIEERKIINRRNTTVEKRIWSEVKGEVRCIR